MKIEDDELRELYKSSSAERLEKLEQGLLHLEQNPNDGAVLDELLREAHTLKGDSRMLGLNDIEMLVHQLEDCLAAIKKGENTFEPKSCDRFYFALDAISQLAHQAITGEEAQVNTFQVLASLMGAEVDLTSQPIMKDDDDDLFDTPYVINQEEIQKVEEIKSKEDKQETEVATVESKSQQIDTTTIRVSSEKLDTLMAQTGELIVAKQRINNQIRDIQSLITLKDEWSKEYRNFSLLFRQISEHIPPEYLKSFQRFLYRSEQHLGYLETLGNQLKDKSEEDTTSLDLISKQLDKGIRNLRLLPLSNVFNLFSRMVRDLAKEQQKQINLVIEGGNTLADKKILEEIKDPLIHLIRNAIDHGIETSQIREQKGKPPTATIRLSGYQTGNSITIEIQDDGAGLDIPKIKQTALNKGIYTAEELEQMSEQQLQSLIFASGFSTRTKITDISGRGVGLDVVRANIEKLKGSIEVNSTFGQGCQFRLRLSTAIATTKALIIKVDTQVYALPIESVQRIVLLSQQDIFNLQGSQTILIDEQPISISWLADILELTVAIPAFANTTNTTKKIIPCIVLKVGNQSLGLLVEQVLDQQDIILKPQSKIIQKLRNFVGATILDGKVLMVLNPQDLVQATRKSIQSPKTELLELNKTKQSLLLVEDSIVIRTQMKRILESADYEVTVAVDGLDGFNKLRQGKFDGIISDVEMPNLDGLSLTERIRQYPEYKELPVILVTTLAKEEDKRRGAQAGANAYLTKGDFDQTLLLETLKRLV